MLDSPSRASDPRPSLRDMPTAARLWGGILRVAAGSRGAGTARAAGFAILLVVLSAAALPYLLFDGFTSFEAFDDEGTLMIAYRDLARGLRLYDDIYALYGPFYYLTVGGLFAKLHVPITHDAVRLVSTAFRLASALTLGTLTYRLSRSMLGGVFTFLASLLLLQYLLHSPTHPEEICLLMTAALPHLVLSVEEKPTRAAGSLAAIGAILAALLLTKINVGVFATLAVALTALRATRPAAWVRTTAGLSAAAGLMLPLALMLPLLHLAWVAGYCAFATATIGAALVTWFAAERPMLLRPRHWVTCLAAMAATAAVTLGITLALGSSPAAILDVIVLQNSRFIRNWYFPLPIPWWSLALAAVAVCTVLCCRAAEERPRWQGTAHTLAALLKLGVGTASVALLALAAFGLAPWWQMMIALFQLLMPFSFLILLPSAGQAEVGLGRASLALLAAFMTLYAFPVGGQQVTIAEMFPLCAVPVLVAEGASDLRTLYARHTFAPPWARAAAGALTCVVLVAALAHQTRRAWWNWGGWPASGLPGASLIHLRPREIARYQWVLQQVASCPALYTFPGLLSFHLWTGRPWPTALNSNDPLALLSTAQQERVVSDLARQPGLCIVTVPALLEFFDRGQIASRPPLLRYIEENFVPIAERSPYRVLAPKLRDWEGQRIVP